MKIDIDVLFELASRSTPGVGWGKVDPALDPVEWFRTITSKRTEEDRPLFTVSVPSSQFPGESFLLTAVTGNGPQSEANAQFYAVAREGVIELVNEVLSLRRQLKKAEATL